MYNSLPQVSIQTIQNLTLSLNINTYLVLIPRSFYYTFIFMNQTNFSNHFLEASFANEASLLTIRWLPSTYEMSAEEYQSIFMEIVGFIADYKVQRWMGYTKDFAFIVSPEMQEWTAGEFNQKLTQTGLKKMAMIIPTDYITHLAVQQSVGEMEKQQEKETFEMRYFDNPQQAKQWLLEN